MATDPKMVEKIAKLLSMEGRTPEESAAYAAKAQELMLRHGIEVAQVEGFGKNKSKVEERQGVRFESEFGDKDVHRWQVPLMFSVAETSNCVGLAYRDPWKKNSYVSAAFVGRKDNIAVAEYVFDYLRKEIMRQWIVFKKSPAYKAKRDNYWTAIEIRRAWFIGAVDGVSVRLFELKRDRENIQYAGQLMVMYKEENDEFMANIKVGSGYEDPNHKYRGISGYTEGFVTGRAMDVNQGIEGGN